MKTIPLSEALKLAAPGQLTARFPIAKKPNGEEFRLYPHLETPSIFDTPGEIVVNQGGYEMETHDAHAALLAHFYNLGPELVTKLARIDSAMSPIDSKLGEFPDCPMADELEAALNCLAGLKDLLSRASTVQIP